MWKLYVKGNIFRITRGKYISNSANALLWQESDGHCGPLLLEDGGLIVLQGTY